MGHEPFAVLLADDFLVSEGAGVTADLVAAYGSSGKSQLSVMEVDEPDISKYGVVVPGGTPGAVYGLVEKPAASEAPSNLASIGRYVLDGSIFDVLRGLAPSLGGEIQLTDAINEVAQSGGVEAVMFSGRRFDCGSVKGYVAAIRDAGEGLGL